MEKMPEFSVVNVVATLELGQPVELTRLADVKGFLYDPAIYFCAYLKDEETRAKISVFASGKMICVGAKRIEDAIHDLRYAAAERSQVGR